MEIEAGNALLREEYGILQSEGLIRNPWLAVPGSIAYENRVEEWQEEKVQEFHDQIKPLLQKTPEELVEILLNDYYRSTRGKVNFPEDLKAINNTYEQDRKERLVKFEEMLQGSNTGALTQEFIKNQKTMEDENYTIVSEKIITLTRDKLRIESQAMRFESSAADAEVYSALAESGIPASITSPTGGVSFYTHSQEKELR